MTGVLRHIRPLLIRHAPVMAAVLLLATAAGPVAAQGVDDETCLMCHDGYDKHLAMTTHRLSSQTESPSLEIACVSCHGGAEVHIEDPSPENIVNPAAVPQAEQLEICSQCHQPHTAIQNVGFDPHAGQSLNCTACHSVHSGPTSLLLDDKTEFCGTCHAASANDFKRRSNHPLSDGAVTCISCHDFTGEGQMDFAHGRTATCYTCHPAQSGPYLYEHEAASSFTTEGGGCGACHMPHGSPNERLLNQSGNTLCRQCHGVPAGHLTTHEGIGAQFDCMDCHSEVHGSYENQGLLDPYLGSKIGSGPGSCWCHNVEN